MNKIIRAAPNETMRAAPAVNRRRAGELARVCRAERVPAASRRQRERIGQFGKGKSSFRTAGPSSFPLSDAGPVFSRALCEFSFALKDRSIAGSLGREFLFWSMIKRAADFGRGNEPFVKSIR